MAKDPPAKVNDLVSGGTPGVLSLHQITCRLAHALAFRVWQAQ
jgi:hypothetical protein